MINPMAPFKDLSSVATVFAVMLANLSAKLIDGVILEAPESETEFRIVGQGMLSYEENDTAIYIYLMLQRNSDSTLPLVNLKNNTCCLSIHDQSHICQSVGLYKYKRAMLSPDGNNKGLLLHLVIPIKYPYNRKGTCETSVIVDEQVIPHSFMIDTYPLINKRCPSFDEDPLRSCAPEDCSLKYGGLLNYFNNATRRCESSPKCEHSSTERGFSTFEMYDSNKNMCINITNVYNLTTKDYNFLNNQKYEWPREEISILSYPYVCVHGKHLLTGRGCDCDWGWTSRSLQESVRGEMFYLCTIGIIEYHLGEEKRTALIYITLGASGAIFVIMMIHCLLNKKEDFDYVGKMLQLNVSMDRTSSDDEEIMNDEYHHFFRCARVHTPNYPLEDGELRLKIGDLVTDLSATDTIGIWLGTCNGVRGTFPAGCAQVYLPGERIPSD